MWELVGELHRHPAAEGVTDYRHPLDVEHAEQVAHAVGVRRDRVVGARLVGSPVAQQVRRDDGEPLGELGLDAVPGGGVVTDSVDQQNRRPGAGDPVRPLVAVDRAEVQCGRGYFAHRTEVALGLRSVISPTSLSGLGYGVSNQLSRVVVVELLLCLLGEESFELRTKLVAARQILVML